MRAIKSFSKTVVICLGLIFLGLVSTLNAQSCVYISDVFPDPAAGGASVAICGSTSEWLVITNADPVNSIDISGYRIDDALTGVTTIYTAPNGTCIPAGGSINICFSTNVLNNSGDTVNLYDENGTLISTVSWTSSSDDVSAGSDTPSSTSCGACPTTQQVNGTATSVCELASEINDWKGVVEASDGSGVFVSGGACGIVTQVVYSETGGQTTIPITGTEPSGTHSGAGCDNEIQTTFAYAICDLNTDGDDDPSTTSVDVTVTEVGSITVTYFAPAQIPTIVRDDETCSYSYLPACTGDSFSPAAIPTATPGTDPVAFEVTVTTSNGCEATFMVDPETCPAIICPDHQALADVIVSVCELDAEISDWKDDIETEPNNIAFLAAIAPNTSIVYSSANPVILDAMGNPTVGEPSGVHSGVGCDNEIQTTYAYAICDINLDGDDDPTTTPGDVTINDLGSIEITFHAPAQAPTIMRNDEMCTYSFLPACTGDTFDPGTIDDADPGEDPAVFMITVMTTNGCEVMVNVDPPACPPSVCPETQEIFADASVCILGDEINDWKADLEATDGTGAILTVAASPVITQIVYTEMGGQTTYPITGDEPLGAHSGIGCENEMETTYAYAICDLNSDGDSDPLTTTAEVTVIAVGNITVTYFPPAQAPTIVRNDDVCTYSYMAACTGDTFDPATIADSDPSEDPDAFTLTVTTSNNCTAMVVVDPPACPVAICSATQEVDANATVCVLENQIIDWKTAVEATDGTGAFLTVAVSPVTTQIVYSEDAGQTTFPITGVEPSGTHSGVGCDDEIQTTYAYAICDLNTDGDNDPLTTTGDVTVTSAGNIIVTYHAPAQAPTIIRDDEVCSYSFEVACAGDIFDPTTIADADPGEDPDIFSVTVSTSNGCTAIVMVDPPACPGPDACALDITGINPVCNLDGSYCVEVTFEAMNTVAPDYYVTIAGTVYGPFPYVAGTTQTTPLICDALFIADGDVNVMVEVEDGSSIGPIDGTPPLLIIALLPDATGPGCDNNEYVTVLNNTCADIDLSGYLINDEVSTKVTIAPGTILSGNSTMNFFLCGLNDNAPGDTAYLIDPAGMIVSLLSYTSSTEGVEVTADPATYEIADCTEATVDCKAAGLFNEVECEVNCGYIACNNKIQVSLGNECEQCVTPDMVLEGTYPIGFENYEIVITDIETDTILSPSNCVNLKYAGKELKVSVECGENSCWGLIQVEDKLPPQLTNCAELQADLEDQYGTSLQCSDLDADWDITVNLIDSIIIECNTDFTVTTEQGLTGDMCSDDYRWTKRYIVDFPQAHGGRDTLHACVISLPVTPISLDDIYCPKDQIVGCRVTDFSPEAIFASYNSDTTYAFAIVQSYPYIINTAGDTVKLTKEHCNVLSSYTDTELPICQFKRKQIRKWTFIDWCTNQIRTCDQVIKMNDDETMVCTAPEQFDIPIGSHCLIDSTILPISLPRNAPLVIYSGCGNVVDTTIFYKAKAASRELIDELPFTLEAIKNGDGTFTIPPIEVPFDSIWFKYEFTNACGESCSAFTEARVLDDTAPTPVCNPDIAISFSDLTRGDDGLVKIFADAFDAGSHDNGCGPVYFKIIRQAELNGAVDGYWNNSGPHGGPDYSKPPIANINRFCDSANGDDFGDVTLNGSQLVSTGNQFWYDDHIKLCCTDDNFNVMMRVFDVDPGPGPVDPRRMHSEPTRIDSTTEVIDNDLFGHFNDCWVPLEVQDKTQILGACQPFSLFCDEYPDNPMDNAPQINMACSDENIRLISKDSTNISECGNGLVIRDWYARRSSGEEVKVCTQSIILQSRAFDPFSIKWPKSYVDGTETGRHLYRDTINDICLDSIYQVPMGGALDCSADVNSCEPTWDKTACSLLGLSSVDDTLFVDGDACMKIIRTWSVIDWCIYDENTSRDNSNNSDRFEPLLDDCEDNCDPDNVYFRFTNVDVDGWYTYQQVLKIVDDQAPVLSGCRTRNVGITEGCTINLNISKTAGDGTGCGQSFLKWIAILQDTSGQTLGTYPGVTDNPGTYQVETRAVPPGIYNVVWIVEDACGNESRCEEQYIVEDAKAPTPICVRDLSTVLMPSTGSLGIWAVDYDLKSEDNCAVDEFSFSPDSIQSGLILTCEDMDGFAAKTFSFKVYVFDKAGNADFCVVTLRLDSKEICDGEGEGGSSAIIEGHVATENGAMVANAQAMVNTSLPEYPVRMMTQNDGVFAFGDNPMAYDYDVSVEKDGDDINGVSTLDIVLIQKHILGLSLLDSPYKVIAADANNDQRVSASDLVQIRKLILGVTDSYPTNNSWRFVDADQTFSSIYNPWPFTEVINLGNLNDNMMNEDFVGVKIGDVNGNVAANSKPLPEVRSAGTLTFNIEDRAVKAGEEFTVAFSADNFNEVQGYQLTLSHNDLKVKSIAGQSIEMTAANIATYNDHLTMSWNSDQGVTSDEVLFTIDFIAGRDMTISESLAINSRRTVAEAYLSESLNTYDIVLTADGEARETLSAAVFELHQNQPNPFVSETAISFTLPEANEASIKIMDVTGKLIMKITDLYEKGYNEISIRSDEIQASGVIYYQLESGKHVATKKMIIIE